MNVKIFSRLFIKELIFGGHLFPIGAVSVVMMSALLFNSYISWDLLIIVYLIFYSIYLNDHSGNIKDDALTNSERVKYLQERKKMPLIIILSVLMVIVILLYFNNVSNILFSCTILVLGLLYGSHFKKITKKIIAFKNIFVSLVWALLVIFYFYYYSYSFTFNVILLSVFVFLRIMFVQIFFDIRDVDGDKREKLLTIPVVLGKEKSLKLLKLLNIFMILFFLVFLYYGLISLVFFALITSVFYSFYYIGKAYQQKNSQSFYLLAIGEPIIWLFSVLFFNFL